MRTQAFSFKTFVDNADAEILFKTFLAGENAEILFESLHFHWLEMLSISS